MPKSIQSLPGVSPHDSVGQLAVANQGIRQEMFRACIGRGALADEAQSVQSPGLAVGTLPRADNQQAQAKGKRCICLRCGLVIEEANILGHTRLRHSEQAMPAFYELPQEAPAR